MTQPPAQETPVILVDQLSEIVAGNQPASNTEADQNQTQTTKHISHDVCFCDGCKEDAFLSSHQGPPKKRSNKPRKNKRVPGEKWGLLGEPSGKYEFYVRYDTPTDYNPDVQIIPTGWGTEPEEGKEDKDPEWMQLKEFGSQAGWLEAENNEFPLELKATQATEQEALNETTTEELTETQPAKQPEEATTTPKRKAKGKNVVTDVNEQIKEQVAAYYSAAWKQQLQEHQDWHNERLQLVKDLKEAVRTINKLAKERDDLTQEVAQVTEHYEHRIHYMGERLDSLAKALREARYEVFDLKKLKVPSRPSTSQSEEPVHNEEIPPCGKETGTYCMGPCCYYKWQDTFGIVFTNKEHHEDRMRFRRSRH